jgi:hypothetical protein
VQKLGLKSSDQQSMQPQQFVQYQAVPVHMHRAQSENYGNLVMAYEAQTSAAPTEVQGGGMGHVSPLEYAASGPIQQNVVRMSGAEDYQVQFTFRFRFVETSTCRAISTRAICMLSMLC